MAITLDGTNGVTASSPATIKASAYLDAAGGNTATINGMVPAPATSPTLTTPIISGNLGAGGANYGTSGQVLTSGGAGASTSWSTISAGGMTLLGTLATTSGTSVTLSGLTLTSYKQLQFVIYNVSGTDLNPEIRLNTKVIAQPRENAAYLAAGTCIVDLATGMFLSASAVMYTAVTYAGYTFNFAGASGLTTASTSITFTISVGSFDAGSIVIYGVK